MHLVDRQRAIELAGRRRPAREPVPVAPGVPPRIADDRGVVRRGLEIRPEGVDLEPEVALAVAQFELVELALAQARHEQFPDPGSADRAHRMVAAVPLVEVPDHRHARGGGRPDGEGDPGHPVDHPRVGAELLVDAPLRPLVEQVQVLVAQRRQKRVRIAELPGLAVRAARAELVSEDLRPLRDEHGEQPLRGQARHRPLPAGRLLDDGARRRLAQEGAHDHPALAAGDQRMHAEPVVRGGVLRSEQRLDFYPGKQHRDLKWPAGRRRRAQFRTAPAPAASSPAGAGRPRGSARRGPGPAAAA